MRSLFEAALARRKRSRVARIVGEDLRDQKHPVAPSFDRVTDHLLRAAVRVHLRGIDQTQAEVRVPGSGRDVFPAGGLVLAIRQVPNPRLGIAAPDRVRIL